MRHVAVSLVTVVALLVSVPGSAGVPVTFTAHPAYSSCHGTSPDPVPLKEVGNPDSMGGSMEGYFAYLQCPVHSGPGVLEVGNLAEVRVYVTDINPLLSMGAMICIRDLAGATLTSDDVVCGERVLSVGSSNAVQTIVVRPPDVGRTSDSMVVTLVVDGVNPYQHGDSMFHGYTVRSL